MTRATTLPVRSPKGGVKAGLLINATRVRSSARPLAPPLFDTMVVLASSASSGVCAMLCQFWQI